MFCVLVALVFIALGVAVVAMCSDDETCRYNMLHFLKFSSLFGSFVLVILML